MLRIFQNWNLNYICPYLVVKNIVDSLDPSVENVISNFKVEIKDADKIGIIAPSKFHQILNSLFNNELRKVKTIRSEPLKINELFLKNLPLLPKMQILLMLLHIRNPPFKISFSLRRVAFRCHASSSSSSSSGWFNHG